MARQAYDFCTRQSGRISYLNEFPVWRRVSRGCSRLLQALPSLALGFRVCTVLNYDPARSADKVHARVNNKPSEKSEPYRWRLRRKVVAEKRDERR